jgi:hypothetical protein
MSAFPCFFFFSCLSKEGGGGGGGELLAQLEFQNNSELIKFVAVC